MRSVELAVVGHHGGVDIGDLAMLVRRGSPRQGSTRLAAIDGPGVPGGRPLPHVSPRPATPSSCTPTISLRGTTRLIDGPDWRTTSSAPFGAGQITCLTATKTTFAAAKGAATMAAWEQWFSSVVAPLRWAMKRCASRCTVSSSVDNRYHDGRVLHAVPVRGPVKASVAVGLCDGGHDAG